LHGEIALLERNSGNSRKNSGKKVILVIHGSKPFGGIDFTFRSLCLKELIEKPVNLSNAVLSEKSGLSASTNLSWDERK